MPGWGSSVDRVLASSVALTTPQHPFSGAGRFPAWSETRFASSGSLSARRLLLVRLLLAGRLNVAGRLMLGLLLRLLARLTAAESPGGWSSPGASRPADRWREIAGRSSSSSRPCPGRCRETGVPRLILLVLPASAEPGAPVWAGFDAWLGLEGKAWSLVRSSGSTGWLWTRCPDPALCCLSSGSSRRLNRASSRCPSPACRRSKSANHSPSTGCCRSAATCHPQPDLRPSGSGCRRPGCCPRTACLLRSSIPPRCRLRLVLALLVGIGQGRGRVAPDSC